MTVRLMPRRNTRPTWVYRVGRAMLIPTLWLRFRPLVTGREHVPTTGPVLLVSNHLSSADTVLIPSFSPRPVQFLAKASLFRTPFRNWFMRSIGAVPVYREAGAAAQEALDIGRSILEAGSVFAVFPEGSRSTTGKLNRGRTGAAWLALESGATVVPIGLIGTNRKLRSVGLGALVRTRARSRSRARARAGAQTRTEIRFGAPIDLSDLSGLAAGAARREATERIMAAIAALSGQERSDAFAEGGRGA